MEKQCARCNELKPLEDFNKKSKGGTQPYCKVCDRARSREYYSANKDRMKEQIYSARDKRGGNRAFVKHHLTEQQYLTMLDAYRGMCWICKERSANHIDHDHNCCPGVYSCGKCVRGLICSQCNTALGLMYDKIDVLESAVGYLKAYNPL